ncbi:hypothetical protein GCM10022222_29090 [Amycolatopsis ultiminotia]|uniref:Secreted protein n=1 Tax=Amycolatopsis ultiminotia TaxID=543629 RepID=A0ABP6W2T4_9PSEU
MTKIGTALATVTAALLLSGAGATSAFAATAAAPPGAWMLFSVYGNGPNQDAAKADGILQLQLQVSSSGYDWATQCQVDSTYYTEISPEPYPSWQAYVSAHCD